MLEEQKTSKKLQNSTRIESFKIARDLFPSFKTDLDNRGIGKNVIVLTSQEVDSDHQICNIKMHKKVNGEAYEKKIEYLKSLGYYEETLDNIEQSMLVKFQKNIDLIQQKEKVFVRNQVGESQYFRNIIVSSYRKEYVDIALKMLKQQINSLRIESSEPVSLPKGSKFLNIDSYSIDNDEVKFYCQTNQEEKKDKRFIREQKTIELQTFILRKIELQQLKESQTFNTLLMKHRIQTTQYQLSQSSNQYVFKLISKDLKAGQNDLQEGLNQIENFVNGYNFNYEYRHPTKITDAIEAIYALKTNFSFISFKIKKDNQTITFRATIEVYSSMISKMQNLITKSQIVAPKKKSGGVQNNQLKLNYEQFLLASLIDKDTHTSLINLIQIKGGQIRQIQEKGSKHYYIRIKQKSNSFNNPNQLLTQFQNEIEMMESFSKTYTFNEKVSNRFKKKINASEKGLYINQATQTLVKQQTESKKFKIQGPIYNVRNFLEIANQKKSEENLLNSSTKILSFNSSAMNFLPKKQQVKKEIFVSIQSIQIFDYFQSKKVLQILQGNLRIQCMNLNIEIELTEVPSKGIKATVFPPYSQLLIQDAQSRIQDQVNIKQSQLGKETITGQFALYIDCERDNIQELSDKKWGILLEQEKSQFQIKSIQSKTAFAYWEFLDNDKNFQPFQQNQQFELEKIFKVIEVERLEKNTTLYTNKKYDLPKQGAWLREIQVQSNGKIIQRNKGTGRERQVRRKRVQGKQYGEINHTAFEWLFENDQKKFQLMDSQLLFKLQYWYLNKNQGEILYYSVDGQSYSLSEYAIGIAKCMIQTNIGTNKKRRVMRETQIVKKKIPLNLAPYVEYRRFKRCSYSITGFKQRLKEFKNFMNEKVFEEKTKHGIEVKVPKKTNLLKLKEFQMQYQGVVVDTKINEGFHDSYDTIMLRGFKRREYLQQFKQFLDQCMKSEVLIEQQSITYPKQWAHMIQDQKQADVIKLNQSSGEYLKIAQKFLETMPKATVSSIERIQSKRLYKRFLNEKSTAIQNGSSGKTQFLFHGSNTLASEIYNSQEGIDLRYSSAQNFWGRGIYFSTAAMYSNIYSKTTPKAIGSHKDKQMLYCEVLTGDSKAMQSDQSIIMPPLKPGCQIERYDSVNGFSNGVKIYVVYTNSKSYPSYLIKYTA